MKHTAILSYSILGSHKANTQLSNTFFLEAEDILELLLCFSTSYFLSVMIRFLLNSLNHFNGTTCCSDVFMKPVIQAKLFHDSQGKPVFVVGSQFSYLSHIQIENISLLIWYRQEWRLVHICAISVANSFLKTLHKELVTNMPVISIIVISNVHPSLNASQGHYIAEMVIACKTKVLDVSHNQLNNSNWIIKILLHKGSMLEELNICHDGIYITSKTACEWFVCIKSKNL